MKKKLMYKTISALTFTLLVFSMVSPIHASDTSVTFDDNTLIIFEPGNGYSDSSLFNNFIGVMPGDSRKQTITIQNKNQGFDHIKVYLRAEDLSEEITSSTNETFASMSDFLSQLSMKVFNGTKLVFDAPADQVDGLVENVLLGSLEKGENLELEVELAVPLNLENKYQNRVGEIRWVFVVEGFNDEEFPEDPDDSWILGTTRPLPDTGVLGTTRPLPATGLGLSTKYYFGIILFLSGLTINVFKEKKMKEKS